VARATNGLADGSTLPHSSGSRHAPARDPGSQLFKIISPDSRGYQWEHCLNRRPALVHLHCARITCARKSVSVGGKVTELSKQLLRLDFSMAGGRIMNWSAV
jgi:hypothetical protein